MKKAFLLLLLFFTASSEAETVTIGTASIVYETPQGFVRADELFPVQLDELDKKFGLNTVLFAKYAPAAYPAIRKADPEALPDWYVHLAYDEKYSKIPLLRPGFVAMTALVGKVIGSKYASDDFKRKLENVFSRAIGRNLTITNLTQKGFVEKKGNARSMLATGHAVIEGKSGSLDMRIATMTTFVLDQYKLITIVQIGRIGSDADLPVFTREALDRVSQIIPASN
ncbi:MAG: hypothetical protein LBE22_08315 [Azoarcus sp.]|jgi:hypothetical protein|nr:hypothetical protein [Azoarcus sp.]